MKKLFTLLALMLCYVGMVVAGEVYSVSFNEGKTSQSSDGYFTVTCSNINYNNKYAGTYNGINFTHGLKMQSATCIAFTSTATSTLTIVQSTWSKNTLTLDGVEIPLADAVENTTDKVRVYTLEDISAGTHEIKRKGSESGILYVSVEYTGASMQQLEEPVISFDQATALVTIAGDANAVSVKYTIDGTVPSKDNGIEYTAPFTVEDGTTVKAIAIGNDVTTISSGVSEQKVLLTGITISDPVIKSYNGTVAITCANPYAVIEYSLDGQTYNKYSYAFTLADNATIYARASRADCTTSGVVSAEINNVIKNVKTKTIYMGYGSFNEPEIINGFSTLVGKEGDAAYGYSLVLSGNSTKKWSNADKIYFNESETRTSIKLSNGAQNTLYLPEGVIATKVTFYSYVNDATSTAKCGWNEINGQSINYNDIPMGAYNDVESRFSNPDVRVFPLDNVTGSFTFKNGGRQLCFIIALDVIEPYSLTTTDTDFYGLYLPYQTSVPEGITAYTGALNNDHTTLTLTKVEGEIPSNTAVLVKSNAVGTYTFNVSNEDTADAIANNSLQGVTVETAVADLAEEGKTVLTLGVADDGIVAFRKPAAETIKANKVYLLVDAASSAKIRIVEGETTGIEENYEFGINNSDAATYDLSGRKVANPAKGLYIKSGKKFIVK